MVDLSALVETHLPYLMRTPVLNPQEPFPAVLPEDL